VTVNAADVQRMVSDVIVHFGFPFTVTSVTNGSAGWDIVVRTGENTLQFTLPDGQPTRMRVVIQERLEAQL
jgi:hypothetical protein